MLFASILHASSTIAGHGMMLRKHLRYTEKTRFEREGRFMSESHRTLLLSLVDQLFEERNMTDQVEALHQRATTISEQSLWSTFRALVNTRPPIPASKEFLRDQDTLLQSMIAKRGISTLADTRVCPNDPAVRLWRGDITTLAVDAIVNAANSQMLGCWQPGHHCIDNAIHTFAGVQLRLACAALMDAQGHEEETGVAKVTPAFNLPSRAIVHTVGPIANGYPTPRHRAQLRSCYKSCLDAAAEHGFKSIAFCCISTGIFGFPQKEAATIAVSSVRAWLQEHPTSNIAVVFNVFSGTDQAIYEKELGFKD